MWTEEQQKAIICYAAKTISLDQLMGILSLDPEHVPGEFRRQIALAIHHQDGRLADIALTLAYEFGISAETYQDLASILLTETWHHCHEDLIGNFQDLADPATIPVLIRAINLKSQLNYLDYDDYGSYYKKCLWALCAIGTPEAIVAIEECTHSDDGALREQAIYRLSKIKTEISHR